MPTGFGCVNLRSPLTARCSRVGASFDMGNLASETAFNIKVGVGALMQYHVMKSSYPAAISSACSVVVISVVWPP